VAEFTRREGREFVEMRKVKSIAVQVKAAEGQRHELLVTHQHNAHASSQHPVSPLREISEAVKLKMEQLEESLMRFEELWFEPDIAVLCGGWIELLMDAVEEDERLTLRRENSMKREKWRVELIGGVQKKETPWAQNADANDNHPLVNGSGSEEDAGGSPVENEEDSGRGWDSGVVEEQSDQLTSVSHNWGVNGSGWGEPRSWTYSDSDQQASGEDDGGSSGGWGSTNHDWGNISSGTTTGSGWGTSNRDI